MRLIIQTTNLRLDNEIRTAVEKKIGNTIRKFSTISRDDTVEARVEIGLPSRRHRAGKIYYAEVNLSVPGKLLRATNKNYRFDAALDGVKDKLQRLIRKYLDKKR